MGDTKFEEQSWDGILLEPGSDEEQRSKEAHENRRIAFLFDCYENGVAEMCHRAGDWYFQKQDFATALRHYQHGCERHQFGMSCFNLALLLLSGRGKPSGEATGASSATTGEPPGEASSKPDPEDVSRGIAILAAQADTDYRSCVEAARACEREGRAAEAERFYAKCCSDYKSGECCHLLSAMHIRGANARGVRDMSAAFEWAGRACDLGSMFGCANVSKMYARGEGVAGDRPDPAEASRYRRKAMRMERERKRELLAEAEAYGGRKSFFDFLASSGKKG